MSCHLFLLRGKYALKSLQFKNSPIAYFNFFKEYIKESILFLFLIGFLVSILDILVLSFLAPLLQPESDGIVSQFLSTIFKLLNFEYNVLNISIFLFTLIVLKFIISLYQEYKYHKTANNFLSNLRKDLVSYIVCSDYLDVTKKSFSEINNIVTKETERLYELFYYILQACILIILVLGYLFVAFIVNTKYTTAMIVIGVVLSFFYKYLNKKVKRYSYDIIKKSELINKYLSELIIYLKYLLASNTVTKYQSFLNQASDSYSDVKYKQAFLGGLTKRSAEPIGIMLVLILIGYNSQYDSIPNIEIAFIALFLYKVFNSYIQFQYTFQKIFSVHGSFQSIIEFKEKFSSNTVNNINKRINSISSIKLKNITFKIDQNKILDIDSDIEFTRGLSYGIVGVSGSGKTSLINLITGIYPQENSIFVNGDDLSHLDIHSYRNHIGYVSQDVYVFEDSLRNNITSWQDIDEDLILKYSEESTFIEVVNKFGLEKPVGSFGKDISGGQKQRLGLTRELIKNPDLLILDEATSALDPNAEVKIMNNILKKKSEMIIVVIAHRLSSLMNVDEILFMDNGNITNHGNFYSLYRNCLSFRSMCNNQNIYLNN